MVTIDFFLLGASEVWNFVSSFEQVWKVVLKTVIISHTNLFKNAILGSTFSLANTLMKLDSKDAEKSNIFEKIW